MGCVSSNQVQHQESPHQNHSQKQRKQESGFVDQRAVKPREIKPQNVHQSNKPKDVRREQKEYNFSLVDQHAIEAPENVKNSIEQLVEYLISAAKSETEQVRAFYRWITENIRYDTESFFSGNYKPTDGRSVLQLGSSVCSGYANLFEEMCKQVGIEVKNINGFAKGYGHSAENPFQTSMKTNHAWNAVKIDRQWNFIECTWGAGHVNSNGEFQKAYTDFYFFTDPQHFISNHFPYMDNDMKTSNEWQLLKRPISLDEFNNNIKLSNDALAWNIVPKSHKFGVLEIKDEVDITIDDKSESILESTVHFYEKSARVMIDQNTFLRKETPKELKITVNPPSPGTFILGVFAKVDSKKSNLNSMMEYIIKSSSSSNTLYPKHSGLWGMRQEAFQNGFQYDNKIKVPILHKTKNGVIEISLGTNRKIPSLVRLTSAKGNAKTDDRYCFIETGEKYLKVKAKLPERGYYKLEIMSSVLTNSDGQYHQMATYLINCTEPATPCIPFPTVYPTAHKFGCVLLEPLTGQLPANTSITCRFKSSGIIKALVHTQTMEQNGDEWIATVTTPDVGADFQILANDVDENQYWGVYKFDIV